MKGEGDQAQGQRLLQFAWDSSYCNGSLYQALKDTQYGGNAMTSLVLY